MRATGLAAAGGRARRGRPYLRILAPPPIFSVSLSGAELSCARAGQVRSRLSLSHRPLPPVSSVTCDLPENLQTRLPRVAHRPPATAASCSLFTVCLDLPRLDLTATVIATVRDTGHDTLPSPSAPAFCLRHQGHVPRSLQHS